MILGRLLKGRWREMIETVSLGLRRQPDLFVVQREDLWPSCTPHMPLNSILDLQAPSVGRGAQGRGACPVWEHVVCREGGVVSPSGTVMRAGPFLSGWFKRSFFY